MPDPNKKPANGKTEKNPELSLKEAKEILASKNPSPDDLRRIAFDERLAKKVIGEYAGKTGNKLGKLAEMNPYILPSLLSNKIALGDLIFKKFDDYTDEVKKAFDQYGVDSKNYEIIRKKILGYFDKDQLLRESFLQALSQKTNKELFIITNELLDEIPETPENSELRLRMGNCFIEGSLSPSRREFTIDVVLQAFCTGGSNNSDELIASYYNFYKKIITQTAMKLSEMPVIKSPVKYPNKQAVLEKTLTECSGEELLAILDKYPSERVRNLISTRDDFLSKLIIECIPKLLEKNEPYLSSCIGYFQFALATNYNGLALILKDSNFAKNNQEPLKRIISDDFVERVIMDSSRRKDKASERKNNTSSQLEDIPKLNGDEILIDILDHHLGFDYLDSDRLIQLLNKSPKLKRLVNLFIIQQIIDSRLEKFTKEFIERNSGYFASLLASPEDARKINDALMKSADQGATTVLSNIPQLGVMSVKGLVGLQEGHKLPYLQTLDKKLILANLNEESGKAFYLDNKNLLEQLLLNDNCKDECVSRNPNCLLPLIEEKPELVATIIDVSQSAKEVVIKRICKLLPLNNKILHKEIDAIISADISLAIGILNSDLCGTECAI